MILFIVSFALMLVGVAIHVHGFMPGGRMGTRMAMAAGGLVIAIDGILGVLISMGVLR